MCVHWGLAMGTLRPTRTPGGARPCRAGGRVAQAPKPPCRSALMGERRTALGLSHGDSNLSQPLRASRNEPCAVGRP